MPAPVPLPLTWKLFVTVHCPSCPSEWHFVPTPEGGTPGRYSLERDAYCPNAECPQFGYVYTIYLALDGCEIKTVRNKP